MVQKWASFFPWNMPNPECKKQVTYWWPKLHKEKANKDDPNAPDNEQDQEMNQALVLEVEPALVAEVNEDTSGEQYADECGIPIGSQEFKLMDGSTLF